MLKAEVKERASPVIASFPKDRSERRCRRQKKVETKVASWVSDSTTGSGRSFEFGNASTQQGNGSNNELHARPVLSWLSAKARDFSGYRAHFGFACRLLQST